MTHRANASIDAQWLARYVEEMLSFPESTYSDQVDDSLFAAAVKI